MSNAPVIVPGNGLSGSLIAAYLAKRGFAVEVYDRLPDMRRTRIPRKEPDRLSCGRRFFPARAAGVREGVM